MQFSAVCLLLQLHVADNCSLENPYQFEPAGSQPLSVFIPVETNYVSEGFVPVAMGEVPLPQSRPIKVVRVEEPSKHRKPRTDEVKTASVQTSSRIIEAAAYQEDSTPRKGFFASLFSSTPMSGTLPKVSGIDVNKRGYQAVIRAAKRHGVDVNLMLRVAKQESGGNCQARSGANARGVLQVIPKTAAIHGYRGSDLYDCNKGADAGVREMKRLLTMYNGNIRKALVGYNCGPDCNSRRRLPAETRHYIRVIGNYTE